MTTLTAAQLLTAKQICGYLTTTTAAGKAFPLNSAIGFCGNFGQESSFDPTALNPSELSYGLANWLGVRLTNLKAWCAANKWDYTTVQGQCEFTKYEFPTQVSATIASW